jgi:hypothetical protein
MRTRIKRWAILIAGWIFILLGIVGLFLPILQGVLFLLIGLVLLSTEYVWAHRLLGKVRARFPKLNLQLEKATARAHVWMHRFKKSGAEVKHEQDQPEAKPDSHGKGEQP